MAHKTRAMLVFNIVLGIYYSNLIMFIKLLLISVVVNIERHVHFLYQISRKDLYSTFITRQRKKTSYQTDYR